MEWSLVDISIDHIQMSQWEVATPRSLFEKEAITCALFMRTFQAWNQGGSMPRRIHGAYLFGIVSVSALQAALEESWGCNIELFSTHFPSAANME